MSLTSTSPVPATTSTTYLHHAIAAAQPLLDNSPDGWYNTATGVWDTTGWWNSANTVTTLGDLAGFLPDSANLSYSAVISIFATTLNEAPVTQNAPGFTNGYYDDEGWWALAWINAYDLTNNKSYLDAAVSIFNNLLTGWGTSPCGGLWWDKSHTNVVAIANELFLTVAASLANRIPSNTTYLAWAQKEWAWFNASGMINHNHNINDGLNLTTCKNNHGTVWSYNQGVILGGLIELNRADPDPHYLPLAHEIATAAISHLATPHAGILTDVCDPHCDITGTQFKGVFMRNLMRLYASNPTQAYKDFINANAASVWRNDRLYRNGSLGSAWAGPVGSISATSQSSALDALVAAAAVEVWGTYPPPSNGRQNGTASAGGNDNGNGKSISGTIGDGNSSTPSGSAPSSTSPNSATSDSHQLTPWSSSSFRIFSILLAWIAGISILTTRYI